jgi:predicted ribosomally synthesized peptide with nif11-like leader
LGSGWGQALNPFADITIRMGDDGGDFCGAVMSDDQLAALLIKLKEDTELQEKLKSAANLDAAVEIANEAGFDVIKEDWLRHQANQTLELSDEELEAVAGGKEERNDPSVDGPTCVCLL